MDKFQSELLAQLKEHNRLTKELVKLQRADYEMKKVNTSTEIFSAVKPKPAHWIYKTIDGTICSRCSNCGRTTYYYRVKWEYCPNCGMPMEIKKEGEEDA